MDLSSIWAAATSVGSIAVVAAGYWIAGPRQLKPTNTDAKVITARKFPNILKVQKFAVKDGSALYLKFGASEATEVPLKVYGVEVNKTSRDKNNDHALVLKDKMKIDVSVMFQVSLEDDGVVVRKNEAGQEERVETKATDAIIKAVGALNGDFSDKNVQAVLEARFDSALRLAAANMDIEELNTHRDKFIQNVKTNLKLDDVGFKLNEVSLRTLTPALLAAYDPSNSYDAEGMKKVVEIVQASQRDRNLTEQEAATKIAETDKEQELRRLRIKQEQQEATLAQAEAVQKATSEQALRVAEFTAENDKKAKLAKTKADQETQAAEITRNQQLELAEVTRRQAVSLATQEQTRRTREAEIATQTAVETAERDKDINLSLKQADAAKALATANEARALAVEAEQSVETARAVATAERSKRVEIINAEAEAGKTAASKKTTADADLYVAQKQAEATKTEAQGVAEAAILDAQADARAITLRGEAEAHKKGLEADALAKFNAAVNILSDKARDQQVDLERVRITPDVVEKLASALSKVGNMTILSGMPNVGGGGGSEAPAGAGSIFQDAVNASRQAMLTGPALKAVLETFGGDVKIAGNLPDVAGDIAKAAATLPPTPVSVIASQSANDNPQKSAPRRDAGGPAPQA